MDGIDVNINQKDYSFFYSNNIEMQTIEIGHLLRDPCGDKSLLDCTGVCRMILEIDITSTHLPQFSDLSVAIAKYVFFLCINDVGILGLPRAPQCVCIWF